MQGTNQAGTVIAERTYGTLTLSLTTAIGGFTVTARSGMIRHDELTKPFEDKDAARVFWGRVAYLAQAQMSAAQIIEKLTADDSYEWNAPAAAPVEPTARIVDLFGRNRRQTRPTMAGAHLKDLSPPQRREITAHRDGIVYLRPGCDKRMLASIERKGYGRLNYETGRSDRRQVIESLTLNAAGLRAAGTALAAA